MDAVSVGGDFEIQIREQCRRQILGKFNRPSQSPTIVTVDVDHQQRVRVLAEWVSGEIEGFTPREVVVVISIPHPVDPVVPDPEGTKHFFILVAVDRMTVVFQSEIDWGCVVSQPLARALLFS